MRKILCRRENLTKRKSLILWNALWRATSRQCIHSAKKIYSDRNSEWHDPNDPNVFAEAFMWFKLAAEGGDVRAIERLGWMYAAGQGVDKNFSKGINLLKEAEEKGSKDAGNLITILQNIAKKFNAS